MNQALNIFNFLGVGLLVGLCALQWRHEGELSHAKSRLEQVRIEQVTKITEQDATIRTTASDLDDTRQRLTASEAAGKDTQGKLQAVTRQHDQSEAQREQLANENTRLQASVGKWTKAVDDRDQALKQAVAAAQKAQTERNEAVVKFNDLVTKYNDVVKQLEAPRSHS